MLRSAHIAAPAPVVDDAARPTAPATAEGAATGDPRPGVTLPAAGPSNAVLAGGVALIVIVVAVILHGGGSDRARSVPATAGRGTIASMTLPGDGVGASPARDAGGAPAGMMLLRPQAGRPYAPPFRDRFVSGRPAGPGGIADIPDDPRTAYLRERGGYTPGARAQYVGGAEPQDRAGRAGDMMIAGGDDDPAAASGSAAGGGGDDGAVVASVMRNQAYMIAAGDIIHATLETPIDTAQPGLIRAIVAQNVRSFDGSNVLIPRGSRLIGEARVNQQAGQHRVLALWSRLIRPDGVVIRLNAQAGDPLGGNGISGNANSRFFARFANAVLQTAMQVGINLAGRGTNVYLGGAAAGGIPGAAGIIPGADLPPTVRVKTGTSVSVLVARDLDFGRVPRL